MPTKCDRWFLYCRSYCLLNMFRAPLCPSSGAQEYYTGGWCLWYLVLWFSSCRSGVELRIVYPVCGMLQHSANRIHCSRSLKVSSSSFIWLIKPICTKLAENVVYMSGMNVRRKVWYEVLKGRAFGIQRARLDIDTKGIVKTQERCVRVCTEDPEQ